MIELENVSLRSISENDRTFLRSLYHSTRKVEMDMVDWPDQQKIEFLDMQFNAQHQHYQQYYPNATFEIIEYGAVPIGRLYLDRRDNEIRIVDIALLPQYCGLGIGSFFLKQIMAEAEQKMSVVRIHVENFNPALRLYKRLEFKHIDTNGVYHLMEWTPLQDRTD